MADKKPSPFEHALPVIDLGGPTQTVLEETRAEQGHVHGATQHAAPRLESNRPADEAPLPTGEPIRVRATQTGYYGEARRRAGDVFTIYGEKEFSSKWMEKVAPDTPGKITTGKQALKQQHDEMRGRKATGDANVLSR